MDFLNEASVLEDDGLKECNNGVILLIADDTGKNSIKDLIDTGGSTSNLSSVNRTRLCSNGEYSLTSVSTNYSIPSFTKEDISLDDLPLNSPKEVKHRRNRHVFASSCRKKTKQSPEKPEKSKRRRRRNQAWSDIDFESLMGFRSFPSSGGDGAAG